LHFSSLARPFWYTTTRARVCSNSGVAKKVRQQTGLIRRGAVYHYRHRVPSDLLSHYGRREIKRPLNTKDKGEAITAGGRKTDPGPCGVRARSSLPDQLSDAAAAVRRPARGCRCLATSRDRADSTLGRLVSLSARSARSIQEGTRTGLPPDWSSTRFVPPPAASAAGCRRTKAEPGQFERLPGR